MDVKVFQEQFGLLGESAEIRQVINKIGQIAGTDISVLLQGESGVGKDVTARSIHGLSKRKRKNLVVVNCGAIPEGIIESELFGHEKGAFTGAHDSRQGYFEKADGGTIFLDEIGDTPKNIQVKLLRVLENGEFFRVGSSNVRKTDVRIVAATNKDLWQLVKEGSFREDLYYRLDTVKIMLPPLRERTEDIIVLFRKFVSDFASKYDSVFQGFSDEAKQLLISYRWPGNVRELRNVAEQLAVLEKSNFITVEILKKYLKGRQHEGLADNLPVLFKNDDQYHGGQTTGFDQNNKDKELIYRALIDMRSEIADFKKLLTGLVYSNLSGGKEIKGILPARLDPGPAMYNPAVKDSANIDDISLGIDKSMLSPDNELQIEDNEDIEFDTDFERIIHDGNVPSIEDAEKFLIQKALTKFNGNRRKASEALGVSERTLYRKLDQYDIEL